MVLVVVMGVWDRLFRRGKKYAGAAGVEDGKGRKNCTYVGEGRRMRKGGVLEGRWKKKSSQLISII